MPLFIVRHQHPPDGCPAHDPFMGARLLNHRLREFLTPFQMAGSVDIYPASTCVRTVATGVPLVEILDRAGVRADAQEVLSRRGRRPGRHAMNGEPLPLEHAIRCASSCRAGTRWPR